jgi:hypothetical protein
LAISRAIAKENPKSKSLLKGLDNKTQVGFVNKTVERILSLCIKRSVPKDESRVKKKRRRLRKHYDISSTALLSIISTNELGGKRKRRRLRKRCSKLLLLSVL